MSVPIFPNLKKPVRYNTIQSMCKATQFSVLSHMSECVRELSEKNQWNHEKAVYCIILAALSHTVLASTHVAHSASSQLSGMVV
jgi:hypothetical protein